MSVESLKVLICDDSAFARLKMAKVLEKCGVGEILEAPDGEKAVEMYKEHRPDLVLMDIVMPRLSGVEALKGILEENSKARVVMASSVGTQENLKEAIDVGAFDFLQKPISDSQLEMLIRKVGKLCEAD